jgi:hypothetical protein
MTVEIELLNVCPHPCWCCAATENYVDVLSDGFAFRLLLTTSRDAEMEGKADAGEVVRCVTGGPAQVQLFVQCMHDSVNAWE